jgi:hypothetical protein
LCAPLDQVVEDHLGVLLTGRVVRLVADGLDPAVDHPAVGVHDLLDRVTVGDVEGSAPIDPASSNRSASLSTTNTRAAPPSSAL